MNQHVANDWSIETAILEDCFHKPFDQWTTAHHRAWNDYQARQRDYTLMMQNALDTYQGRPQQTQHGGRIQGPPSWWSAPVVTFVLLGTLICVALFVMVWR